MRCVVFVDNVIGSYRGSRGVRNSGMEAKMCRRLVEMAMALWVLFGIGVAWLGFAEGETILGFLGVLTVLVGLALSYLLFVPRKRPTAPDWSLSRRALGEEE